jgi:O-antigen/teichoic acid export membrane protein
MPARRLSAEQDPQPQESSLHKLWNGSRTRLQDHLRQNPALLETAIAFAIKIIGAALSFSFSILLARLYGATGVGQFGLAITTLTITTAVSLFGLDYVLIRAVAGDVKMGRKDFARGTINAVARIVTVNAIVLFVLLTFGFVPLIENKFGMVEDTAVLRVITIGLFPFALMRIVSSALRSTGRVLLAQAIDGPIPMAVAIMGLLGFLAIATNGSAVTAGLIYIGALSVAVGAGAIIYARQVHSWPAATRVNTAPLLVQGWPIVTVAVTGFVVDWFVLMVLAAHNSSAEVGQFRTAWQITSLLNLVVVSFDAVAGPRIAAAFRVGDVALISRMWRQAVVVMLMMSLPVIAMLMAFPALILGVFGEEFRAADGALRILLLGQLVNVVTGPIGSILIMTGRERWSLAYSLVATVVAGVLSILLIPRFGIVGAAWASAITIAFRNSCAFVIANQTIGLRLWGAKV